MLLGRFPEIVSSDIDELAASLIANAGGRRFDFEKSDELFVFRVNAVRLTQVGLIWIATNNKVTVNFGATEYARRVFQLRNSAQVQIGRQRIDSHSTQDLSYHPTARTGVSNMERADSSA